MRNYVIVIVVVVIIIIIIGLIVFGVNSNKTDNNGSINQPPASRKRNKCVIEVVDTADKTFCTKTYGNKTIDLEFCFCLNKKYSAEYHVRNVNFDEHDWRGYAKLTCQSETFKELKSYIEYDPDDCKYILTLVDKNGEIATFNNPSRCITVKTKLEKCCDKQSSASGSHRSSETRSSSDCDDHSSERNDSNNHRSSSGKSSSGKGSNSGRGSSDDHGSSSGRESSDEHDSSGKSDSNSSNSDHHDEHDEHDSIDPYSNTSYCNDNASFYPDSCTSGSLVEAF
uniref:Transmembrane protein n=1 Tax=Pithovirus LCPAC401 TaxID=2506595 RepID=A0A481ZBF7_9VIRU|nr:MAG: hypothetical protein LCPAC401_03100 [Pithovirus LCPAC401]